MFPKYVAVVLAAGRGSHRPVMLSVSLQFIFIFLYAL